MEREAEARNGADYVRFRRQFLSLGKIGSKSRFNLDNTMKIEEKN
jgi:hypothetical protein